jgi:cyclic pyranopterin phosphate synthase
MRRTHRVVAEAILRFPPGVAAAIRDGSTPKGNIYEAARLAGILAAKRTGELIPLCHTLPLSHVAVDFETATDHIRVTASARTTARTGVEMEALVAGSVAALTLYDMLKALDHDMVIEGVRLLEKSGGKSGEYHAPK